MSVDQQARDIIRSLTSILDDLPLAHDQLWMHLLPSHRRRDRGSRQQHAVLDRGSVVNLEVVDLLDPRAKPGADLYRTNQAITSDAQGRRLGVLPTLDQWVRLIDDRMVVANEWHETPFALVTCGPVCRFTDRADEVALWPIYPGDACTEIERTHWRKPTVASNTRWLREQIIWIGDQEWASTMERDLRALLSDIRAITGSDQPATMLCLTETCGNVAHPQHGGAWYRCSGCDRAWSRAELLRHAERNSPRTLVECSKLLGIPERSLQRYLAMNLIVPIEGLKRGKAHLFYPREVDSATRSVRFPQLAQQPLVS